MPSSAKISTFELLVQPIGSDDVTFARTAITGYFLTFSNVGPSARLAFMAVIPKFNSGPYYGSHPNDTPANRELTTTPSAWSSLPTDDPSGVANHRTVFDIDGGAVGPGSHGQTMVYEFRPLGETPWARVYTSLFYDLPSGQTASFRILPFLGAGPDLLVHQSFEVRGFLAIGLYADPHFPWNDPEETEILLQPEQRHILLPREVSGITTPVDLAHVGQTNTALTPAEGAAVTLTRPTAELPPNVNNWMMMQSSAGPNEVKAFANILAKIV